MREILFRGKWLKKEKWIEGNLFIPDIDGNQIQICSGTDSIRITYNINPYTIGQYTGVNDKNGKKIFENDIVKDNFGSIGVVCFSKQYLMWQINFYKTIEELFKYSNIVGTPIILDWDKPKVNNSLEVIGNIYDNPELVEKISKQ